MEHCRVSIIIKALNEEQKIAKAIESALRCVSPYQGEVILADSLSSDQTVLIASRYPIRIVQLAHAEERCCGVGAQLGYQHASGEYLYILDGDMELAEGFLSAAIDLLDENPALAGVGGRVVECNLESLEYQARQARAPKNMQPGVVDRLDMGGLYRRSALERVGFFTNSNLHSYEEFDLAVRLRAQGFVLARIDVDAVNHYGHSTPAYELLWRRWRSRYICGSGEVLKAAIGKPHFRLVVRELRELWLYLAVISWWGLMLLLLITPYGEHAFKLTVFFCVLMLPFFLMAVRKRSVEKSLYSVASWNLHALGMVWGLIMPQRSPRARVDSVILHDQVESAAGTR